MNPWSVNEVTNYLRTFLADPTTVHWPARITIVYVLLVNLWEVLDAWIENIKGSADEFQIRAINSVARDLERIRAPLQSVGGTISTANKLDVPPGGEYALLWGGAVVPMVIETFNIASRLVSLRNQLVATGLQPIAGTSIMTSAGIIELLPSWSQPIPDWFSEQFLNTASRAIVAAEKSAPGEPPTARDVTETVMKEYAALGKAAVVSVATTIKRVATPWLTLGLVAGLLYLAKK